jgi:hypothetical protein
MPPENKQTISLKALTGSKRQVKSETIYKSILLNLSSSDSSKSDPNKYGKERVQTTGYISNILR